MRYDIDSESKSFITFQSSLILAQSILYTMMGRMDKYAPRFILNT